MNVLEHLREMIDGADHAPQSRLPPERALAARLGVSRGVVRRALDALEAEGKVWRHVGRGTFVGSRSTRPVDSFSLVTKMTNPTEVMEVRLIIEPRIAALAALRATSMHTVQMERLVQRGQAATDATSFEKWDSGFHRTIAEAAGNNFLLAILDAVNALRREKIWGRLKEESFSQRSKEAYCAQHRAIVAAISDRHAPRAEKLMRAHLEDVRRAILRFQP